MFIIRTIDDEGANQYWDGSSWVKKLTYAATYESEIEAEGVVEHFQSVSFGTRTDNAEVVNMGPKNPK